LILILILFLTYTIFFSFAEINECASNPCQHGTCHDLINRYTCTCQTGYAGVNCKTSINFHSIDLRKIRRYPRGNHNNVDGKMTKRKRTNNNNLQNTTQKTKDRVTTKTRDELRFSSIRYKWP